MNKNLDDLEAVRAICDIMENFSDDDRKRILRWTVEKMKMEIETIDKNSVSEAPLLGTQLNSDIRSFINTKNPNSDNHLAAVVAYYYKFQAPHSGRKDEINSSDLQEACRLAQKTRLKNPIKTLNNALAGGLLNKGATKGFFSINTVGENLVAMSLPMPGKFTKKK